ncbi:MAG: YdcF family protein, partial [Ruminococcus sp.]|nr:YdcF family protein [Ruminococcus sp.]
GLNPDIAVVTDGFHQFRAKLIAQKQGVTGKLGAFCADTDWVFVPTYTVREWLALPTLLWK